MKINFSPPDISDAEIDQVVEVLKSGWITTGPKTKEFERKIAEYCGTDRAVCLNSATACMENILRVLGIGEGDEVITSAYTYTASASVIEHVGARMVLVDVAPNSYNIDIDCLEKAINEKTKAIITVDIAGVPCDYDNIYSLVRSKTNIFKSKSVMQSALGRIAIIDDAAHAFGSDYNSIKLGNVADFTSFSFHAVKNLTTGEGGALTWKNLEGVDNNFIYRELMLWSLHGQNKDALSKTQLGSWEYDIVRLGYKCNMTDLMAGIGIAQLSRYDNMLEKRRQIVNKYLQLLNNSGLDIIKHFDNHYNSSCHLLLTRVEGASIEKRNEIIRIMASKGIATNVHYKPLPMHTAYMRLGYNMSDYTNAYQQYVNEISLPLHTLLSDADITYVANEYKKAIKTVI